MILPRRRVASLLLASFLAAGPATAVAHQRQEVWQLQRNVAGFLSEAWAFVSRLWERAGSSTAPLEKEGGSIDPFGNPKPSSQPPDNTPATVPSASGS